MNPSANDNGSKRVGVPPESPLRALIQPKIFQQEPRQFITALAHEIRNPLANIRLAIEMLETMVTDAEQKTYLDILTRSSGRINEVVTDMLSSFQGNGIQEILPIHQILDEALEMAADRIALKQVTVRKDYSSIDCNVLVDRQKMKIALTNIIINAIDAMAMKKGRLKLLTKSVNGRCIIEIEDNGVGIPTENLKKIFKPFFTGKAGGMGLGLSTTKDILRFNQVRIAVKSEEGSGTRFILTFHAVQRITTDLPA